MKKYYFLLIGLAVILPVHFSFAQTYYVEESHNVSVAVSGCHQNGPIKACDISFSWVQTNSYGATSTAAIGIAPNIILDLSNAELNDGAIFDNTASTSVTTISTCGSIYASTTVYESYPGCANDPGINLVAGHSYTYSSPNALFNNSSTPFANPTTMPMYEYALNPVVQSSSISFAYPLDGLSTPDFRNWVLTISSATNTYQNVSVTYWQSASSTYSDTATYAPYVSSNPFVLQKSSLLMPIVELQGSSTWYALACLNANTSSSACSSVISFTVNPGLVATTTPIGQTAGVFNGNPENFVNSSTVSSTIGQNPYSCLGGILGISVSGCFQWGLFTFAQILFQPLTPVTSYFQNSISNFEVVPPFSGVFQTIQGAESAVSSSPTGEDLIDPYFNFGSAASTTPGFVILSSTTMSSSLTPDGKTLLFNLEDAMFSILDLALIFFVPWHWWHKKHSASPKT